MTRMVLAAAATLVALPAFAQAPDPHAHHHPAPAQQTPAASPAAPADADPHAHHHAAAATPTPAPSQTAPAEADPHAHHQMAPADPHAGQAMPAAPEGSGAEPRSAADLPVGSAPPPPPVAATLADQVWDPSAMARARRILAAEHGGMATWNVVLDRAEVRPQAAADGYAWQGWARYGGDINRWKLTTEGEGRHGVERAEVQALYARAIGPYFDVEAGVRQDIRPKPSRTHATVGLRGLAPYWFDVGAAAYLSDQGELTARGEVEYDLRLTNRLILQPSLEATVSAQDAPEVGLGSGLSWIEAGARLRYDVRREFAPFVGVNWERRFGNSRKFVRALGGEAQSTSVVVGARLGF